ncbi:hypothetical protein AWB69_01042 [Caballeronia udeis]|uniref:Uncharacterized protein n=1 Tax=Caballeronia udeis TaxID=1232866 RepID=A0A158FE83_9BURK|nr:hypothetical protein AWB69_01042 [Caballeronia udeis]
MKRRTARQLVAQLADLKHLARCSALRASALSRTIDQSPDEETGRPTDSIKSARNEVEQESFAGAAHEIHA